MSVLTKYILRQLIWVTVFITLALTLAVWLSQSLRFMDYIVNRGLPVSDFLALMSLMLPRFFGVVLPIATFVAVLFFYNKLANESELAVMRAAGLSQWQIAKPGVILAAGLTVVVYSVSLYFLPASYREFKDLQYEMRSSYSSVLLQEGVFNTLGENLTVYVRSRTSEGTLRGVMLHDAREQPAVTLLAERGAIVQTDAGPRVLLIDGSRQSVDEADGKLSMLYFDRYTVDIEQLQQAVGDRWRQPEERYLQNLLWPRDTDADQRYASELIAEGHRRLQFPLYTLAFAGIGLATILAGEFSRRGQAQRIGIGVGLVAGLQAGQLALVDLTIGNLALAPLGYLVAVAAIAAPFYVLLRHPGRRTRSPRLASASEAAS
ncbi:LPS export ABC transporter permease LptF [Rhodovibrio sodomensis]|uniref:LPS export ABC transporter permease LptF n=1 Tax=Rhodovibrio sodomensis TaxID=1088 RepID=A0ABS1DG93_9PROT|nr:LPS export ABC transporter permease LptF [Rhodovibrio sodomensis]MBK1669489.1 LPS export ABC transporter permease LptF [Rhodovibrio sodomensis]